MLTGAAAPQPGNVTAAEGIRRPEVFATDVGRLWVMGVHGGAGETTVATHLQGELFPTAATEHRWPDGSPGQAPLVLVGRTNVAGLQRLQEVATLWAAGVLPGADLLGAVLVADAPGRLPSPLASLSRLVAGGVPHVWRLDWNEGVRLGEQTPLETRKWRATRREVTEALRATKEGNE
jgi:hypothetical protein